MADLQFTAGLDDKQFHDRIRRIDGAASRTAKSVGAGLKFAVAQQALNRAFSVAGGLVRSYVSDLDEMKARLETSSSLAKGLGRDLAHAFTDAQGPLGALIDRFEAWRGSIVNFFAGAMGGDPKAVDEARAAEERSMRERQEFNEYERRRISLDSQGASPEQRIELENKARRREIAQSSLSEPRKQDLYEKSEAIAEKRRAEDRAERERARLRTLDEYSSRRLAFQIQSASPEEQIWLEHKARIWDIDRTDLTEKMKQELFLDSAKLARLQDEELKNSREQTSSHTFGVGTIAGTAASQAMVLGAEQSAEKSLLAEARKQYMLDQRMARTLEKIESNTSRSTAAVFGQ